MYSGHKRAHSMNWQAIVTPDSLISLLVGPYSGTNNDWSMQQRSGYEAEIRSVYTGYLTLYIYRDPAYRASFGIMYLFEYPKGRYYLIPEKQAFNKALVQVRISVENTFGSLYNKQIYTAFSGGLVTGLQPIIAQFTTTVLLANCYICLRRPENRFLISPITIEEYLY